MTIPFLVCAAITAISAFVGLGFSIASVLTTNGEARIMADYTVARSVAFSVVGAIPLFNNSLPWLEAVAIGMVIVQSCDAIVGLTIHHRMKTFGPAGTALANLAALVWLVGQ